MNKLLIVCGPTATGKTKLALHLASRFDGELISADSRQIYKYMDIGTGKDFPKNSKPKALNLKIKFKNKTYILPAYEIDGVSLWMYDVVEPDEEFSVAHFQYLAGRVIYDIWNRGKLPIMVGGTGLYIKSLIVPLPRVFVPPNKKLREKLEEKSLEELQELVRRNLPDIWNFLNQSDRSNPRRLIRKLETALYDNPTKLSHGVILSDKTDIFIVGLKADYHALYKRIDERVETRVNQGIVGEIKKLLGQGYSWDLPAMTGLGYKEWKPLFENRSYWPQETGEINENLKNRVIARWKWDEHGYARRQVTWFKKQTDTHWFNATDPKVKQKVATLVARWYT